MNSLYANTQVLPFWIDTLCIPVARKHEELRSVAISKINQTFSAADKVLVLDRDLELASVASPLVERFAKISMSQWHRRLWTLVEGNLAIDLYFKFSDGVFKMNDLLTMSFQHDDIADELALSRRKFKDNLMGMINAGKSREDLTWVTTAMEYRTTKHLTDESIRIATIMGIESSSILKESTAIPRMQRLYHNIHQLPSWILFSPGRRIDLDRYRWAPRSFLPQLRKDGKRTRPMPQHRRTVKVDECGVLHFKAPGYILSPSVFNLARRLFKTVYVTIRIFRPCPDSTTVKELLRNGRTNKLKS